MSLPSWPSARASGWFCSPPAGETRTRRCTRSGAACATSSATGQPIEFPSRMALSMPRASRTPSSASARAGMSRTWSRRSLRPYPGRSGKVRDHVDPPSGQHARGGHQVLAGDREAVDVDDRYAGPTRAASAMDRRSAEVQALRHPTNVPRHGRIVSRARTGRPDPACNIAVGAVPASSPVDAPSGPRVLHLKRPPSTSRGRRSHRCGPTGLDRRVTDPDHGVAGPQDGARG
jgi:hypothetical protein